MATDRKPTRTRRNPQDDDKRRLALLQRSGLFKDETKGAEIRRALSVDELLGAYRLVHDTFVEQGYILPQPGGVRIRPWELDPSTATFLARKEGQVVGVQTLAFDSAGLGLPSDGAFREEIDALRGPEEIVCEATNEAIAEEFRRSSVPTELMRAIFSHARNAGCTRLITTVSPSHTGFYEFIGFEKVSQVRSYSAQIEDPVVVVCWTLSTCDQRWADVDPAGDSMESFWRNYCQDSNPYNKSVEAWDVLARKTFADPIQAARLLSACSDLAATWDEQTLEVVTNLLGPETMRLGMGSVQSPVKSQP